MDNGIFDAWWFDPLVATTAFAVFINWYWYEERKRGLSSDKDFASTIGLGWSPLFNSAGAYWIGIYMWKCVAPPPAPTLPDGIPGDLAGLIYLLAEIVSGIILYDFFFFFIHWAMHEIPLLRSVHKRHHSRPEGTLESRDTLRHSLVDGSIQVLVNIAVQRHTPWGAVKSRLARSIHNVLVVWMLTESHTASPVPCVFRQWCVGVREHRLHHYGALTHGSFGKHDRHQQFFGYLDNIRVWWFERQMKQKTESMTTEL